MDLSIIVPCHNLEDYIIPLLGSLNEQQIVKYDVELIFVLDDCTDNTEQMILRYPFNNINIRNIEIYTAIVHSCGLARNIGLNHVHGKYVWFMDGDDWLIHDNAIEMLLDWLEQSNEPLLRFEYSAPPEFRTDLPMMVWQYIFTWELIKDIRFTERQPHEDIEFMNKIIAKMGTDEVTTYHEKIYYYNYNRPGSNMSQYTTKKKIDP